MHIELLELVGDFRFSTAVGSLDTAGETYVVEAVEQIVERALVGGFFAGLFPDEGAHKIPQNAHEVVDANLLVGPVVLGF